ncbi:unnamed protein product [Ostreobium quekettii]|uniref:Uncharacterized protein n=1 Tax=Ostreobium quekettii TaxID=121088 RepID=A0A8S1J6N4_9CHLO|nr:unnamed protein product [Ostreobium quekettii]
MASAGTAQGSPAVATSPTAAQRRICACNCRPEASGRGNGINGVSGIVQPVRLAVGGRRSVGWRREVRSGEMARLGVACVAASGMPDAILFDCDGVLVDTEKDGHRVAFNKTFEQKGLQHEWGVELYGKLLETGGGKERMTKYFTVCYWLLDRNHHAEERTQLVKELHKLKTDTFMTMIESGAMPLRPGVKRLIEEAIGSGITVAVCSTSNERAVSTIVRVMLGPQVAEKMRVFAGDVVEKKKPSPDIYQLAAQELGVDPQRCVVVEDSKIGLQAAKAAGMRCVVTKSSYTQNEDFGNADAVFDCIGDTPQDGFSLQDLAFEDSGGLKVSS